MRPDDVAALKRAAQWLYPIEHNLSMRLTFLAQRASVGEILQVPKGWVLVPTEPTTQMIAAAVHASAAEDQASIKSLRDRFREDYMRAVSVAPEPT